MPNMSYCRFTNTLQDLHECQNTLDEDGLPENPAERKAALRLIRLCGRIFGDHELNLKTNIRLDPAS